MCNFLIEYSFYPSVRSGKLPVDEGQGRFLGSYSTTAGPCMSGKSRDSHGQLARCCTVADFTMR